MDDLEPKKYEQGMGMDYCDIEDEMQEIEDLNLCDIDQDDISELDSSETEAVKDEEIIVKKPINMDDWDDVLGSGALLKKVITEGEPDTKPKRLMICTINYKCTLENGILVETVKNATIQQGDLEMVQAIDLAISLMNVGEKCHLYVQPRLAYGTLGNPPVIPPSAVLILEIELLQAEYEKETLTMAERKKIGNNKKIRGNFWYGRGEYTFAIQCYRRAMEYLDEVEGGITIPPADDHDPKKDEMTDAELQDLLEDRISVHNNMAVAQMKQGSQDAALQSLQNVLRCQPNNVKALYRKSMILKDKNDIPEAMKCLQKAKVIEPDNPSILKEIKIINGILLKQKNYERELAKRMFNSSRSTEKSSKQDAKSKKLMWASILGSIAVGLAGVAAWRFKFS